MFIFAHRGLKLEYPENTLPAFQAAADLGFGIELDVRLAKDGKLVCKHDPIGNSNTAELTRFDEVAKGVISKFGENQKAAIHVKFDEQKDAQLQMLDALFRKHDLYEKAFLFDLTLESAKKVRDMNPAIRIALSVGEANYSPTIYTWEQAKGHLDLFDAVWWDEWKVLGSVYNESMRHEIRNAGKSIYAISPELHKDHGNPHADAGYEREWQNFIAWGIEGVCTAHPRELEKLL
ncbi:MAG: hypothetical protein A3J68_02055 [Candidatus Wildermuthbacteria bacterium RIFCSPHIGHO2_02_FULL_48_16]|uniref:GP-PDE domain-containing protein n=1 Tax=Candidatus Wildermuthbacteria bacterium RIFCSPHIGHO2_02_FULL_48_16 TaxID=1802453 RepID=A0A1G2R8I5_9BACT|nr:MAG: hypothetical protein A3J68_02055 [Candidatus Wildermuthbacteria bacterium RIFCSPHIGHO2_02_FULL_48_16]